MPRPGLDCDCRHPTRMSKPTGAAAIPRPGRIRGISWIGNAEGLRITIESPSPSRSQAPHAVISCLGANCARRFGEGSCEAGGWRSSSSCRPGRAGDRRRPGIGAGIARRLHAAGARIAVFDRRPGVGPSVAAELDGLDLAGDVRAEDQVAAAVEQAEARLGPLSILVNNAGITGRTDLSWNLGVDEVREVFDVNVIGPFLFCKAAVPRMLARGYGRIVNVASIAGKEGNPTLMPYSASKAAVIAMTKSLAKELAGKGNLTVNAISPAVIRTAILDGVAPSHGRVHDLEDPDGPDRDDRRGRRAGPLPGQPGGQLHHRPVLRHQRRPGDLLIDRSDLRMNHPTG